jgi:alkaline phosphatase D
MGAEQEGWLLNGLSASPTRWDVMANQVTMGQCDIDQGDGQLLNMDMWDGYAANRNRVLRGAAARGARNLVVITGDKHLNVGLNLHESVNEPDSPVVGVEIIGTSVTSGGNGEAQTSHTLNLLAGNPHMKYANSQRGYVRCRVTADSYSADYRVVEHVVGRRDANIMTDKTLVVAHDRPGLLPG